ncbi:MAG TPA: C4-dicarboxylate ABC transporter substrate-binding protein, partial [Brevibacterium sp.]|nr:C4-dicarboxylate ABC transporter substrate-binding protein [Brevibacterium sp.]
MNDAEGFAFGAPQEEVDAAISDLEPQTIVFQASAASPESPVAESNVAFAEEIEKRSGGKITVETHYGHPIADHTEIFDALADGRVDVSYTNPAYEPDLFPAFDDLVSITSSLPESPMAGELVAVAALTELAWSSEQIREDFEAQGLVPLVPVNPPGAYFSVCGEPGSTAEDWQGRQVRIGSTVHSDLVSSMGGSPVSLEYLETYEALQRRTIDCTMIVMSAAVESGYFEIAPNMQYTGEQALPRVFGSMLAGSTIDNMPTPYQQIIFDAWQVSHYSGIARVPSDNLNAVAAVNEHGGEIEQFGDGVLRLISENRRSSMDDAVESG